MILSNKTKERLFLIFLGVVFLSIVFLVFKQFTKTETEKILDRELKEIKLNQKVLIENEKNNYILIDSLKTSIIENSNNRDKIIEKHYYTKEIINNKILENEKHIINSNVSIDSIKKYLSSYKYKPIGKTGN